MVAARVAARIVRSAGMVLLGLVVHTPVVVGQDSVSRNANGGNGLPGDALSPYGSGLSQRASFVVDLTTFETSWGTTLGVAPLLKSGRVNTARFNAFTGPCAISSASMVNTPYPSPSYTLWTQPGGGLSAFENNTSLNTTLTPSGTATVFGVAMIDFEEAFSGVNSFLTNQVYGAQVAFDPAVPDRLYVTRVNAAVNSGAGTADRSQLGLGGVDETGAVVIRADGFGASGAPVLVGDNYFRVRTSARSTTLNILDNNGAVDTGATDWLLVRSPMTHAVPNIVGGPFAGGRRVVGADFTGNFLSEGAPNTLASTTTHRPLTTDHRGSVGVSPKTLFGAVGTTAAVIARSIGSGNRADAISVFGLTAAGSVSTARTLVVPASIIDPCDSFAWPVSGGDFRQYDNQSVFRGGSAPVAVGQDALGNGLVAAVVYNGTLAGATAPVNALVVGRFDPTTSNPAQWSLAAWVSPSQTDGKDILGDFGVDGAPNTNDAGEDDGVINALDAPIGRLAALSEGNSGLLGPSISAPGFDNAGNVYFVASVALRQQAGSVIVERKTVALLRGVLDPASFCYRLELVLETGRVFAGRNSGRHYKVAWIGLADEDSLASATLWSNAVSGLGWNNLTTQGLPASAPQHLGGLVLPVRVVYDADNNGTFADPTAPGGNAGSVDEAYNVMLYVGNITPPVACDSIDFNNDGVTPDVQDITDLLSVFGGGPCSNDPNCNDIDFNNDGVSPDNDDIDAFLRVFGGGAC